MRQSRKLLAVLSTFAAVAAFSACSSQSGGDSVLTVWTFKQSEIKALEAAGADWGKQNNMTVKVSVYTPDDAYRTKIQAAAKSKTLPDIISIHSQGGDWKLAQAGIVQDITDDFTSSWQDQLLPGVITGATLTEETIKNSGSDPTTTLNNLKAGHFYGVPYMAGTPGVIYANKTLLTAAGVDPSTTPASWQDWVAAIQKTQAHDSSTGGLATGLQVPETGYYWLYRPMAYAYLGADAFYGRQGRSQNPSWASEASIKTLELYNQLTPLWVPGVLGLGIDQADQAFASGKVAWVVGGTFTLSSLSTFGLSPDHVTIFPVPAASGGVSSRISYQASPLISGAVSSTSKHRAQAISFLKYLTSVKGATAFAENTLDLPAATIPVDSLSSPLLKQLVALVTSPAAGQTAFAANDFSADPGGTVAHDTAVQLAKFPARSASVPDIANTISQLYTSAWKAVN